jgi:hypothetical protein
MPGRGKEDHEKKLKSRCGKREADGEAWLSDNPFKVGIS